MHKKESQKPPEHTSEHVKSKNFLGACPQTPLTQFILWAPLFAFALGPSNPPGGPVWLSMCPFAKPAGFEFQREKVLWLAEQR